MVRKEILFKGRVTGVGFRYTSQMLAEEIGLTGWVRNVGNDVAMEVQGEKTDVEKFIDDLHQQRFIRIESYDINDINIIDEKGFRIVG